MQLRALQEGMQKRLGELGDRVNHLRLVPRRDAKPDSECRTAPGDPDPAVPGRGPRLTRLANWAKSARARIEGLFSRFGGKGASPGFAKPALGRLRSTPHGLCRIEGEDRVVQVRQVGDRLEARPLAIHGEQANAKSRKRAGLSVTYALSEISCSHERLELPQIDEHLLPPVIEQRASGGQFGRGEMEISWIQVKTTPTMRDLLVVTVDRQAADTAVADIQADGYRVGRIVTPEVALASLLRKCSKEPGLHSTQAIVHLGELVGSVGFMVDDELALGREFPLAVEEGIAPPSSPAGLAGPDEDFLEPVIEEISRSLMLLNHRFQGRKVERILLASDCHPIERLRKLCMERFHVPADLFLDAVDIDTRAFGEGEIAQRRAAAWILPIAAAAVQLDATANINLLPAHIRNVRTLNKMVLASASCLLALALGMSVAHTPNLRRTADLEDALEESVRHLEINQYQIDELKQLYVQRMRASGQHANLVGRREPVLVLQTTLNHLSAIAPDHVSIERLDLGQLHRDEPALTMVIKGEVRAASVSVVQEQFNAFVEGIRRRPELSTMFINPVQIETPPGETESKLTFDITIAYSQQGGSHATQD